MLARRKLAANSTASTPSRPFCPTIRMSNSGAGFAAALRADPGADLAAALAVVLPVVLPAALPAGLRAGAPSLPAGPAGPAGGGGAAGSALATAGVAATGLAVLVLAFSVSPLPALSFPLLAALA